MNEDLHCCKHCRFQRAGECHKGPPPWHKLEELIGPRAWCGSYDFTKEAEKIMAERRAQWIIKEKQEMLE